MHNVILKRVHVESEQGKIVHMRQSVKPSSPDLLLKNLDAIIILQPRRLLYNRF